MYFKLYQTIKKYYLSTSLLNNNYISEYTQNDAFEKNYWQYGGFPKIVSWKLVVYVNKKTVHKRCLLPLIKLFLTFSVIKFWCIHFRIVITFKTAKTAELDLKKTDSEEVCINLFNLSGYRYLIFIIFSHFAHSAIFS